MNTDKFTNDYKRCYGRKLNRERMIDILTKNYQDYGIERELIIIMEELAELIQQVSKVYRHQEDPMHLLEEIADVYICLEQLKMIARIPPAAIDAAMLVKLNTIEERLKPATTEFDYHDYSGLTDE